MTARLVLLSGARAGQQLELGSVEITLGRSPECTITYPAGQLLVSTVHATVYPAGEGYRVRDEDSKNGTFINKKKVADRELRNGDVIELGPGGPTIQFATAEKIDMHATLEVPPPTLSGMYQLARTRTDDASTGTLERPLQLSKEFVSIAYRSSSRTTRRAVALLAVASLIAVVALVAWNLRTRSQLQEALDNLAIALEAASANRSSLARNLAALETENDSLQRLFERSAALESEEPLGRTVTRNFSSGVALIAYGYGYGERGTGRMLRYRVDRGGKVMQNRAPNGVLVPQLTFAGDGPLVEKTGSATGFLIDSTGWLITNRHVAVPWRDDADVEQLRANGLQVDPTFTVLRAYFPSAPRSYPLVVERVSDDHDLALLRSLLPGITAPVLTLGAPETGAGPGDPVVMIGYPTGVHNLMFRVSSDERTEIVEAVGEESSQLSLAAELARRGLIQPLITSGAVTDTTGAELIHSAEGTGGSSGGPIIDASRRVVAVHYAYVTSPVQGDPFRTQRGVQVRWVWELLPGELAARLRSQR